MTPKLGIRHLRMLVTISQSGSLTKAGEALGLTPSAVSHRVREAERRLGYRLFDKTSGRLRLTRAGEYLLASSQGILKELVRAEGVAARLKDEVRHVVRVGMTPYSSYFWLPDFLAVLSKTHPSVQIEVVADAPRHWMTALSEGTIDLVIAPGIDGLTREPHLALRDDELVAIVAPDHPLADRRHIEAKDMEPYDFYTYSMEITRGFEYQRFLQPAKVNPRRYITMEIPEVIVEVVRRGLGISILSRWALSPHFDRRHIIPLRLGEKGLPIQWFALLRETDAGDSVAALVAAELVAVLDG